MTSEIDLADRLADALEAAGYANVRTRLLGDREEGTCVRRAPGGRTRTYMDGSAEQEVRLTVMVRSSSELEAIEACDRAEAVASSADLSSGNGSYEVVRAPELTTSTQPMSHDMGLHTYQVTLTALVLVGPRFGE